MTDFWSTLAARCYVSRKFVKNTVYRCLYGGSERESWLDYVVASEMNGLIREIETVNRSAVP